jgi:hypothetical protein
MKLSVKVEDEYAAVKAIIALEAKKASLPQAAAAVAASSTTEKKDRKVAIDDEDEDKEATAPAIGDIAGLIDKLPTETKTSKYAVMLCS